jgi:hypothetical protein
MIKPKSLKGGQWQKNEGGQAAAMPKDHLQHSHGQVQGRQGRHQGSQKLGHPEYQNGQSNFPGLGQHIYNWELIQQTILDSAVTKFKRPGSSSARLSSDTLLPGQATNAWVVGTSTDDIPALSTLGGVVRTMGPAADALPPGMVRTC